VSLHARAYDAVQLIQDKHWDHTGDPSLFPEAAFYVGADDLEGLSALKQESEKGRVVPVWFGADDTKHPVAAFDDSSDLYGDGSVLIVDAHGHTPGHINLLVRTGKDEYVLLASDGCHHTLLLSPEAEHAHRTFGKFRAYGEDESVEPSHQFYEDVHAAQRHLEGLRACQARKDVLVVIAHNEEQWKRWFGGERYGVGPDLADWRSKGLDG
jgi:glyoxylase-like metal-dependent hydrolase (beta-lactamase superfamily II)